MSRKYIIQVIIANIIAFPVSYLMLGKWLEGYAYKAPLYWWLFVIPAAIIFSVAAISVSHTVLTVARINQAQVLKYE